MAYIALKRLRFGEAHLRPGDEVPVEQGRNYNLLLRQGLIANLEKQNRSEEVQAATVGALKARIDALEKALVKAGGPPESKGSPPATHVGTHGLVRFRGDAPAPSRAKSKAKRKPRAKAKPAKA